MLLRHQLQAEPASESGPLDLYCRPCRTHSHVGSLRGKDQCATKQFLYQITRFMVFSGDLFAPQADAAPVGVLHTMAVEQSVSLVRAGLMPRMFALAIDWILVSPLYLVGLIPIIGQMIAICFSILYWVWRDVGGASI